MLTPNVSREGTVVRARIDRALKARAEKNLRDLGISLSDGIRMFLAYAAEKQALPFLPKMPNAETRAAIEEARRGVGMRRFASAEEFFDAMESGRHETSERRAVVQDGKPVRKGVATNRQRKVR